MFDQCDKLGEKISVAVGMPMFRFDISAAKPFVDGDGMAFTSADAAWQEALRLVRDIEGSLRPGESWSLTIRQDTTPIFRINVTTEDLRQRREQRSTDCRPAEAT